jgi:uncharacterized protein (DUF2147 family)
MKVVRILGSSVLAVAALCAFGGAQAQMTPVGLWKTIDDKDGTVKSEVRIIETDGVVTGKIERDLGAKAKPDDKCVECKDDRKDKPVVGLEIIRAAKKTDGKDVWEGGNIVEPSSGTVYKLKMTPVEGGNKLEVRGFIGFALLGRTQTWIRIP